MSSEPGAGQLAAQLAKKGTSFKLSELLDRASKNQLGMPIATMESIWGTLNEREQTVLRALAESVKPETEARLGEYLNSKLHYNRFVRALRSLRSLNLVVVKPHIDSSDVVELHPLVREFIRRRFPKQERMWFIDAILQVYSKLIGLHKPKLKIRPTLSTLQQWTEAAELDIEAGKFQFAFDQMSEVGLLFANGAYPNEFARVAKRLFDEIDWENHSTYKHFDQVLSCYHHILVHLGRTSLARELLEKFEKTIPSKDARYIFLCDMKCYQAWVAGEFQDAIDWGKRGQDLKKQSDVDTTFDTSHNLALAQRDAGDVDSALKFFLAGKPLEEVIDPEELDEDRGGPYYGNIGRCLHFMGQIDPAIICYRKSAILIEKDMIHENVVNQGFARKWIGELLLMRGQPSLAKVFLEAAKQKWEQVCPPRAEEVEVILRENHEAFRDIPAMPASDLERACVAWMYGREDDLLDLEGHRATT